jgi:hypothetical protein
MCSIANVQVNELTLGICAPVMRPADGELMAVMLVYMNLLDCKAVPVT